MYMFNYGGENFGKVNGEKTEREILEAQLAMSTAELELKPRICNALEEVGIRTVRDLLHSTREQLLSIPNFSKRSLAEVFEKLETIGFVRQSKRNGDRTSNETSVTSHTDEPPPTLPQERRQAS